MAPRHIALRRGAQIALRSRARRTTMNQIVYIVGLVVIVMAILAFVGMR